MSGKPHIVIVAKGGAGWLGGRQYCINLLRALIAHRAGSGAFDISVLVRGEEELVHYQPLSHELRVVADLEAKLKPYSLPNRIRWKLKQLFSNWANPRFEEPVAEMGASFAYPFTSKVVPSADWISDFQYSYFPDRMSEQEVDDRKAEFGAIVDRAQRIVLSSYSAEHDCHRLFPASIGRTAVLQFRTFADPAWLAVEPEAVREAYHLPERFALVSNWLLPTKNHGLILEALALIPPERRKGIHVVCTGDIYDYRNPGFYNRFLNAIHKLGVADNVSVLGVIPKSDQIQLLRLAHCYLQPSLFEGWNTGVEEARMLGRPLLLSDMPVHREQDPPGAIFFDPTSPQALADRLEDMFGKNGGDKSWRSLEAQALSDYEALQRDFGRTLLAISQGQRG